jgi:hypothetical protein
MRVVFVTNMCSRIGVRTFEVLSAYAPSSTTSFLLGESRAVSSDSRLFLT